MAQTKTDGSVSIQTEFNLHGVVGIRLIDPSASDVAAVARQLGPVQGELDRDPEITIRFVDKLKLSSRVRFVGLDEGGFTDDAFLVLRSRFKAPARVAIPFDQIGNQLEIVCERGIPAVPLLVALINLTALTRGILPLHAAAFSYKGKGVVSTGWSKGGKTESLLAFMSEGARYVGDEWVYIDPDDGRIWGIPEPIRLWDWHLRQLPEYAARIDGSANWRLRALRTVGRLAGGGGVGRSSGGLQRVGRAARRQLHVDIPPKELFPGGAVDAPVTFDRLFFLLSQEGQAVRAREIDPLEVAARMQFSLQFERTTLANWYQMFRFAFPNAINAAMEEADAVQVDLLRRAFEGKPSFVVEHPYPVAIPELFKVMSPLC